MKVSATLVIVYAYIFYLYELAQIRAFNITQYCTTNQPLCVLRDITYTESSPAVAGDVNHWVLELTFEDSSLTIIPKIFDLLPNLLHLTAENCGITKVSSETFRESDKVKVLDLTLNSIVQLPSKLFIHMYSLEDLRLGHNYISILYSDTFSKATLITDLQLNSNKIQMLPRDVFAPLTMLEYIDLEYNRIEMIQNSTFKNNLKLKTVQLNNNQLLIFDADSLTHVPFLNLVDISFNSIQTVNLNSVNTLRAIRSGLTECNINGTIAHLIADMNPLTHLNVKDFSLTREIGLRGNLFQSLQSFTGFKNIRKFDVSYNPITNMNVFNFEHFKILTELRLGGTNLTLHYGAFSYLSSLMILDISNNNLKSIDFGILRPLQKLEKLYVDGNGLTDLNYYHLKDDHPSLTELGIMNNPWNCSFLEKIVKYCQKNKIALRVPPGSEQSLSSSIGGIKCSDSQKPPVVIIPKPKQKNITRSERCSCPQSSSPHTLDVLTFILVLLLFLMKFQKCYLCLKNLASLQSTRFRHVSNDIEDL